QRSRRPARKRRDGRVGSRTSVRVESRTGACYVACTRRRPALATVPSKPKHMTQALAFKNVPLKIPVEADRDPVTGLLPCLACPQCCQYVAIEIDTPETQADFDQMRWYLYHPGIEIY